MIVRILLWDLGDSMTTLAELRDHLPDLPDGSHWVSNDATERFGLIALGDPPEEALARVRALIGREPVVGEEFDVEG